MRVGVYVVGLSMGGPAGVANAKGAEDIRPVVGERLKGSEPAPGFTHRNAPLWGNHRQARAVIPAVLQLFQAFQQQGRGLLISDIANDSAHIFLLKGDNLGYGHAVPLCKRILLSKSFVKKTCCHYIKAAFS